MTPEHVRDQTWLLNTCRKIASGLKRPPSIDHDDVVSDAAENILRIAHKYPVNATCSFDAWIITCTKGDLRNKYEKEWNWVNRRVEGEDDDTGDWLNHLTAFSEEGNVLDREHLDTLAVDLSPQEREVYLLLLDGMTPAQMAEELHLKLKTVEQRLQRMRDGLRKAVRR